MATILVVEDDKPSLDYVVTMLQKKGHLMLPAQNSEEAWKWLEEYVTVDIMFLDSDLGDEDGWDFLLRVRQNMILKHLPVVIYTGHSEKSQVLRYLKLKVQYFLVKPYDLSKLEYQIDRALSSNWMQNFFSDYREVCESYNITKDDYYKGLTLTTQAMEEAYKQLSADALVENYEDISETIINLRDRTQQSGFIILEEVLIALETAAHLQDKREMLIYIGFLEPLIKIIHSRIEGVYGISMHAT